MAKRIGLEIPEAIHAALKKKCHQDRVAITKVILELARAYAGGFFDGYVALGLRTQAAIGDYSGRGWPSEKTKAKRGRTGRLRGSLNKPKPAGDHT